MKSFKEELIDIYDHLYEAFGVGSKGWNDVHCTYSRYMFCHANRLSIVGEYLTWKWFVEEAKKYSIPYYIGIDEFLEAYKIAVEKRVNLD